MKSFNLSNLRNKPSYNGFDRSFRNLFTAKVGEILPVNVVEMSPGDKVNLKIEGFTRTQPLQTSAFTRITEHYDSFFVPYRLLWRFANDTFTMVNNTSKASNLSSALVTGKDFPHLSLSTVVSDINKKVVSKATSSKLAQLLGYGIFDAQHSNVDNTVYSNVAVTPFRFLAYQKIWADWFRNDRWQELEPWTYNIDYITPSQASVALSSMAAGGSMSSCYDLQYANYKLDYFLGGLPNSQFGSVASVNSSFNDGFVSLSHVGIQVSGSALSANTNLMAQTGTSSSSGKAIIAGNASKPVTLLYGNMSSSDPLSSLSVLSIRQAMFVQKWKEIALSGNKDYKTQIEKHFGKSVSNVLADKCTFVDGISSNVVINDVTNQNLSSSDNDANQAFIKGKGVGSANGSTHFEAPEHGIFLTLYWSEPLLDWSNFGVDAFNIKTSAEDFAIPELDRIGMDKMSISRLDCRFGEDQLLAYVPRYFEYKSNFDRVNGEFLYSLADWTSCLNTITAFQNPSSDVPSVGDLLSINPSILNSIMGVNANQYTSTDQLLVGTYFDMQTSTCLDSNGLPY